MSKSQKRAKEETARFATMPEADLLQLRNVLHKEINVLINEKNAKVASIQRIGKELADRNSANADRVVVTDHAVVRYLERYHGIDAEHVRNKIVEMTKRAIRQDFEFLKDPVTGLIVVCKEGSQSVATIMDKCSELDV